MSFIRSLLSLILAFLFVTFLFTAVTSYALGDLMQRENIKELLSSDVAPALITQQCEWFCREDSIKEQCIDFCIVEAMSQTGESVEDVVNGLYDRDVFGITLDQIVLLMNQTPLLSFLAIVCLILIVKVSEEPLNILGKAFLTTAISLFIASFSPNFIIGSSVSGIPVLGDLFEYLAPGLELQTKISAGLFVIGVFLLIVERLERREK